MSSFDAVQAQMDDRHRWMVTKLKESFETHLLSTTLDEFLCNKDTMPAFTEFLSGRSQRVLCYLRQIGHDLERSSTAQSLVHNQVPVAVRVAEGSLPTSTIKLVYFVSANKSGASIQSSAEIVFGEVGGSVLADLRSTITEVCVPLIERTDSWGKCSDGNATSFRNTVQRFVATLPQTTEAIDQTPLRTPDASLQAELKPGALVGAVRKGLVQAAESLVVEWAATIESELGGARKARGGADVGPRGEVKFWNTRLRVLRTISEQLKSPECSSVVGVLLNSQSKHMRRWRSADTQLSDALQEAKDAVKILEAQTSLFDTMYDNDPVAVAAALSSLSAHPRLFASSARHTNAGVFFASLFARMSVQMTVNCHTYVKDAESGEVLWVQQRELASERLSACAKLRQTFEETLNPLIIKNMSIFEDSRDTGNFAVTGGRTKSGGKAGAPPTQLPPLQSEDVVKQMMEDFNHSCSRLARVEEMLLTASQFKTLAVALVDLPLGLLRHNLVDTVAAIDKLLVSPACRDLQGDDGKFDVIFTQYSELAKLQDTEIKSAITDLSEVPNGGAAQDTNASGNYQTAQRRLESLKRFGSVESRTRITRVLADGYINVFNLFDTEVQDVLHIFEQGKGDPPRVRDAPPAAGGLMWARALMRRIEQPMHMFKNINVVMSCPGAPQTVKLYNKVATSIVKFESEWYREWRSRIVPCKAGLKNNLLATSSETLGGLQVNMPPSLRALVAETDWLVRQGFAIPDSAKSVLQSQQKLKSFLDGLDFVLTEHRRILKLVPPMMMPVLTHHVRNLMMRFQPGLENLTWQAPDIEVFLFRVQRELTNFENVVVTAKMLLEESVEGTIMTVQAQLFFDFKVQAGQDAVVALSTHVQTQGNLYEDCSEIVEESLETIKIALGQIFELRTPLPTTPPQHAVARHHSPNGGSSGDRADLDRSEVTSNSGSEAATAAVAAAGEMECFHGFVALLSSYCDATRRALYTAVKRSLLALARYTKGYDSVDRTPLTKILLDIQYGLPHHTILPSMQNVLDVLEQEAAAVLLLGERAYQVVDTFEVDLLDNDESSVQSSEPASEIWGPELGLVQQACEGLARDISEELSDAAVRIGTPDVELGPEKFLQLKRPQLDDYRTVMMQFDERKQAVTVVEPTLEVGPVRLRTQTLQDAVLAELSERRSWYTNRLREQAKGNLSRIIDYVDETFKQFENPVETLNELASVMGVLQALGEFSITLETLVVEDMYEIMRQMGVLLAREETEAISKLHSTCEALMERAAALRMDLMVTKRPKFERLLDTQLKTFMVATIHLRNTFESSGPLAKDIAGPEAVHRLRRLKTVFNELESERKVLAVVESLYGMDTTTFVEFDQTAQDLSTLSLLYDLYEEFSALNSSLRVAEWVNTDLNEQMGEVQHIYDSCNALPVDLHRWSAYGEMKTVLGSLLECLPLLALLAGTSIRDRHWREVMNITAKTFSIDGLVIQTLLSLDLPQYTNKIQELARRASGEAELESTLKVVDVEWNEQVFPFATVPGLFKGSDPSAPDRMILDVEASQRLIDRAEDAHINMATMMSSPSLGPHKTELVSWMAKLNEISSFLKRWLEVQALWKHLASVFGHHGDELTYEASQFAIFDRDYNKFLLAATECHNILHWCYGGDEDVTKIGLLENLAEGLEGCRKSLSVFLDKKRQEFPRFYFASDAVLLDVISVGIAGEKIVALPRALKALFSNISAVHVEQGAIVRVESAEGEELELDTPVKSGPHLNLSTTLSELVTATQNVLKKQIAAASDAVTAMEETEKFSDTERIVALATTDSDISTCQAETIFLRLFWTAMTAQAIEKVKLYRHAHMDAKENMDDIVARFTSDLTRKIANFRKDGSAMAIQKLQSLLTVTLHLREVTEMVASARCKDVNDFGWLRHCRYVFFEDAMGSFGLFDDEDAADPGGGGGEQPQGLHLACAEQTLKYNCEYFGVGPQVYITPATERHLLLLSQTMGDITSLQGSLLYSGADTAAPRQEAVRAVNGLTGNFSLDTMCSELTDGSVLSRLLTGLSRGGVSGCFYNFDKLTMEAMSIFAERLQAIAMRMRAHTVSGRNAMSAASNDRTEQSDDHLGAAEAVDVKQFSVFIAASLPLAGTTTPLPDFIKSSFRSVNFTPPNIQAVVTAHCHAAGAFKNPKAVAEKIHLLSTVLHEQLNKSETCYDYGIVTTQRVIRFAVANVRSVKQTRHRRTSAQKVQDSLSSPSAMMSRSSGLNRTMGSTMDMLGGGTSIFSSAAAAAPDKVVVDLNSKKIHGRRLPYGVSSKDIDEYATATAFIQVCRYRLLPDHRALFDHAVHTVFQLDMAMLNTSLQEPTELRDAFIATTEENSLIPSDDFVAKVSEIYAAARRHDALMLVGPSGSGKTSAMTVVLGTLAKFGPVPRVYRINPRALEPSHLFGIMRDSEWVDGIFPTLWRQIEKSAGEADVSTWIVFDGPLTGTWLTHLSPILEGNEYFMLDNGDRLAIPPRVKIVFEASGGDLKRQTGEDFTAVKLSCPINFTKDLVTWEMMVDIWLRTRRTTEAAILHDLMRGNELLDSCINLADTENAAAKVPVGGRLETMFAMLTSLLRDSVTAGEVLTKPHIECLLLFSIAWSFGGLLKQKSRERFHQHLRKKSGLVPQDEPTHTIFDYYVTETADWITWKSEVESLMEDGHPRCEENGFVHTPASACIHFLMDLVIKSGQNVCIVGMRGSSRSAIVNQFLTSPSLDLSVVKTLTCSRATSGFTARDFLQRNTERRTGSVYGAPGGKPITVNFDDVGLTSLDGDDELPEVLRLLAEEGKWFVPGESGKIGEWRWVPDSTIVTTLEPATTLNPVLDRYYRQFSVFYLPPRDVEDTKQVLNGVLYQKMRAKEAVEIYSDVDAVMSTLASISVDLLDKVRNKVLTVGNNWHHTYGLTDLLHIVRGMTRLSADSYSVETIIAAWRHEWERVFVDRSVGFHHSEWILRQATLALTQAGLIRTGVFDPSSMSLRSSISSSLGPLDELIMYLRTKHIRLCDLFTMCANGCARFQMWSTLTGDQLRITAEEFKAGLVFIKFMEGKDAELDKIVEYVFTSEVARPPNLRATSSTVPLDSPSPGGKGGAASPESPQSEPVVVSYLGLRQCTIKQREESIASRPVPPAPKPAKLADNLAVKSQVSILRGASSMMHDDLPALDLDALPSVLYDFMEPPGSTQIQIHNNGFNTGANPCNLTHNIDDAMIQAESHLRSFNSNSLAPIVRPLRLTRTLTRHLLRVARALSIPGTSAIMVGENELGISSITKFAAHIAGYSMEVVNCTNNNTFSSDMRALYRKVGCKGSRVTAYICGDNLDDSVYEKLNSFLTTGEIYDLFSTSEMDALFEGLQSTIKKEGSSLTAREMFFARVRDNLHLVISFRSFDNQLQELAIRFPSLFGSCYINWFDDGVSGPSFVERGISFGRQMNLLSPFSVEVQEAISHLFATSHLAASAIMAEIRPCLSPAAFDSFIECFLRMFVGCKKVHDEKMNRLHLAIKTCEGTREAIRGIEEKLVENAEKLKAAEAASAAKLLDLLAAAAAAETAAVDDEGVDSQDDEELLAAFVAKQRKQKSGAGAAAQRQPAQPVLDSDAARLKEARKQVKIWQAKITPKRTDALRGMREPPPLVRKVVDMVVIVLHKALDTDLYRRRGKDEFVDSWNVTRGVIMDPRFQQLIEDYDPATMDAEASEFLQPYLDMVDVNSASVRHAARECYVMYEWISRVVEYAALAARPGAHREMVHATAKTCPTDMTAAEHLAKLQDEFDQMVQDKQDLEQKRSKLHSRLRLAQQLDASFGQDVTEWKSSISENGSEDEDEVRLLCNCAVAAAYVAYAGAMPDVHRASYVSAIEAAAKECFQKSIANLSGEGSSIPEFVLSPESLIALVQPELTVPIEVWPQGDFRSWMTPQDACIILMQTHCERWPLIVDPLGASRQWLVKNTGATVLTHVEDSPNFLRDLRRCLVDGHPCIIADADLEALWRDQRIRPLLLKHVTLNSRLVRSIRLGQDELEYNDSFQLYITTATRQVEIPHDYVPYLAVVHATVSQAGLEHSLIHHVMNIRQPRDWSDIVAAQNRLNEHKDQLGRLEIKVLELLGQGETSQDSGADTNTRGHDEWIQEVSEAKKAAEDAEKVVAGSVEAFEKLSPKMVDARATAHTLVAVLDVVISLSRVNKSYQDFEAAFKMLDIAIRAQDADDQPLSAEETMRVFIQNVYPQVAGGMLELDCKAFLFLLALKTEAALGRVPDEVFEWFDNGLTNEATGVFDQYLRYSVGSDARRNASRRPKQQQGGFATVRLDHIPWTSPVSEVIDQFGKYKSEWVGWRENKHLTTTMPHDLHSKISKLQTLMIAGTLRPSRFLEAAERYSRDTLDTAGQLVQTRLAPEVMMTQSQRTPIYLLDQGTGADSYTTVEQFAVAMNKDIILVTFSGAESLAEIRSTFETSMNQDAWFMIKCAHRNQILYKQLAELLNSVASKDLNPLFRFWVSSNVVVSTPRHEGHFVIEAPQTLRWNLARLLAGLPEEYCDCSSRTDWLIILHNICFIHCVLQGRQLFGVVGMLHQYEWQISDLWSVLEYAKNEFGIPDDPIPLQSVRNFMAAIYTRHMSDPRDKTAFYALLDSWVSTSSLRQGFEFQLGSNGPAGYKAPSSLFLPVRDARQSTARLCRFKDLQAAIATIQAGSTTKLDQGRLGDLCGLGPNARINSQEATRLFEKVQQLLCRSEVNQSNTALEGAVTSDRLKSAATVRHDGQVSKATEEKRKATDNESIKDEKRMHHYHGNSKTAAPAPTFIDTLNGIKDRIPTRVGPRNAPASFVGMFVGGAKVGVPEVEQKPGTVGNGAAVSPVVLCIQDEVAALNNILTFVRAEVRTILSYLSGKGYQTPAVAASTAAIVEGTVPEAWEAFSWRVKPSATGQKLLSVWLDQLCLRHKELERLNDKRLKIPSMWLGGLTNPQGMLAALRLEAMTSTNPDPSLRVDITARDHSHLREPPMDGIFVHRVNLDGANWEGGTLKEPQAGKRSHLPVLHLTYAVMPEATGRQLKEQTLDSQKSRGQVSHTYSLPAYYSAERSSRSLDDLIFHMDVTVDDLPTLLKWTAWSACLTL